MDHIKYARLSASAVLIKITSVNPMLERISSLLIRGPSIVRLFFPQVGRNTVPGNGMGS
jgi:hypothetical protein